MKPLRSQTFSIVLIPVLFAAVKLVLHLSANAFASYGYFRDELYYLACASNLDAGYVDHPPFSIAILTGWRAIFGDSLVSLRFLPAVVGAAVVFMTGMMARRLGGGRYAQSIACLAALLSLAWIAYGTFYSMNIFDVFFWTLAMYLLLHIVQSGDQRYWLPLGVTLGFGLLNKISVLWLGFGIVIGLLLTDQRRWFRTIHPYRAAAVAVFIFSPYIVWNALHGWPHLEFIANASARKYGGLNAMDFVAGQLLTQNPATVFVWLGGLLALFFDRHLRTLRIFAWVYLAAFLILVVYGHSKADYLSPMYGILFAAGGVLLERFLREGWRRRVRAVPVVVMSFGVALIPYTLPILPVQHFVDYSRSFGVQPPSVEGHHLDALPQFFADMFGWEEQGMAVVKAWQSLSPQDRAQCAIFAENYGRCAAIDFYGRMHGLPPAIGSHNSYWMWGTRGHTGELVIILGGDLEDKQEAFASVEIAGVASNPYCMPYENNLRVYICRGLRKPLATLWPGMKTFI